MRIQARRSANSSFLVTVVVTVLLVPLAAMAIPALLRLTKLPGRHERVDPFSNRVGGGTGSIWCKNGMLIPSPSGKSYSCPVGGLFRCDTERCRLYRYVGTGLPWQAIEKHGERVMHRGDTRPMWGGAWYIADSR